MKKRHKKRLDIPAKSLNFVLRSFSVKVQQKQQQNIKLPVALRFDRFDGFSQENYAKIFTTNRF